MAANERGGKDWRKGCPEKSIETIDVFSRAGGLFTTLITDSNLPPFGIRTHLPTMPARRFPPPWSVEEQGACFAGPPEGKLPRRRRRPFSSCYTPRRLVRL